MPGFTVDVNAGAGLSNDIKPFYSYTWELDSLFEDLSAATIYAKDCVLPTFSASREEVDGASVVYKFASMVNWEDVRLTFYDISHNGILMADRLKAWRNRVWTPETGLGFADNYKKQSIINVFNLDISEGYKWTLYGSWPQSIRDGDLTYTRTEVKLVEVVVAYDWAEISAGELSAIAGASL